MNFDCITTKWKEQKNFYENYISENNHETL